LGNPTFKALVEKLTSLYSRIFINTPPINDFSDALAIGDSTDSVVLVYDFEKDGTEQLIESVQRLREADIPILGAVMCNVSRPKNVKGFRAKPKTV
jgi:Mrp family chromosome partitioning ATPase